MKKILSILMIAILGCVLFAGCGSSENLSEMEKARKQVRKLESKVKETYNNAEGMLESDSDESDKYSFNVHVNLKRGNKTDKNLSDEYNKICKKIFNNIQADAAGIEKIHELNFIAIVDDKSIEDSSVTAYKRVDEDGTFHLITLSDAKDFKVKTKAEKEEEKKEQQTMGNVNEQLKEKNQIVKVPDEDGYFEAPKLLENIKKGNIQLKSSNFKVINKNGKKIVKVNLIYKNEVLIVGVVKNIRNNIESALSDQCDEIYLTITQENPMDLYECKYVNGSWDKEVN
ncbi:hypothetical protein [Clostridium sporogenes]|uniref:hypothetical protein n=1 Tax=Clostridium sporogenes TaxID=1509 RepID=UPI000665AC34|nr:hypothetical protein [Clostridium sporogenes]